MGIFRGAVGDRGSSVFLSSLRPFLDAHHVRYLEAEPPTRRAADPTAKIPAGAPIGGKPSPASDAQLKAESRMQITGEPEAATPITLRRGPLAAVVIHLPENSDTTLSEFIKASVPIGNELILLNPYDHNVPRNYRHAESSIGEISHFDLKKLFSAAHAKIPFHIVLGGAIYQKCHRTALEDLIEHQMETRREDVSYHLVGDWIFKTDGTSLRGDLISFEKGGFPPGSLYENILSFRHIAPLVYLDGVEVPSPKPSSVKGPQIKLWWWTEAKAFATAWRLAPQPAAGLFTRREFTVAAFCAASGTAASLKALAQARQASAGRLWKTDLKALKRLEAMTQDLLEHSYRATESRRMGTPPDEEDQEVLRLGRLILQHAEWVNIALAQGDAAYTQVKDPFPLTETSPRKIQLLIKRSRENPKLAKQMDVQSFLSNYSAARTIFEENYSFMNYVALVKYLMAITESELARSERATKTHMERAKEMYHELGRLMHAQIYIPYDNDQFLTPVLMLKVPEALKGDQYDLLTAGGLNHQRQISYALWGWKLQHLLNQLTSPLQKPGHTREPDEEASLRGAA